MKKYLTAAAMCVGLSHSAMALDLTSSFTTTLDPKLTLAAADENQYHMIVNKDVEANLSVQGKDVPVKGRISMRFTVNQTSLSGGVLPVSDVNVVLFSAPQSLLTNKKVEGKETGVLGFSYQRTGAEALAYNARSGYFTTRLEGSISFPNLAKIAGLQQDEKGEDSYISPKQSASLNLAVKLSDDIKLAAGDSEPAKGKGAVIASIIAHEDKNYELNSYAIRIKNESLIFEWGWTKVLKFVRNLCVQPVRFSRLLAKFDPYLMFYYDYTGEGLNFGKPELKKQWAKANLYFNIRSWKTIYRPAYWSVDTVSSGLSAEELDVLAEVEDDDCIEVFFIDQFDPESKHGGGFTVRSGDADAQVVTSDVNAVYGIDKVHLAHEMGHVVDLSHPNSPRAELQTGTTGTLMCPSGFKNDNPAVNSGDNRDNLNNPLITFQLKFVDVVGVDCSNNADCGAC